MHTTVTTTTDSGAGVWSSKWFAPSLAALGLAAITLLLAIILRAADPTGSTKEILSEITGGLMAVGWGLAILTLIILAFAIIRRQDEDRARFAQLASAGQWMTIGAMVLLVLGAAIMP